MTRGRSYGLRDQSGSFLESDCSGRGHRSPGDNQALPNIVTLHYMVNFLINFYIIMQVHVHFKSYYYQRSRNFRVNNNYYCIIYCTFHTFCVENFVINFIQIHSNCYKLLTLRSIQAVCIYQSLHACVLHIQYYINF